MNDTASTRSTKRFLFRAVVSIVSIYVVCVGLLSCAQRDLLYHPNPRLNQPAAYGLDAMEEQVIKTQDGESLTAWYAPAEADQPTMIYFHGNAGHMGHRAKRYQLITDAGYGLLAVSYRGFGRSTGAPTEAGLYEDARAALQFLKDKGLESREVIYRGESLGTGVATQLATEEPPLALVLSAPYSSIVAVASEQYPWIPVKYLLKDHYDSLSKIALIKRPVIIFHGENDTLIPIKHAELLYEAANEPKRFVRVEGAGHNTIPHAMMVEQLGQFLQEIKMP